MAALCHLFPGTHASLCVARPRPGRSREGRPRTFTLTSGCIYSGHPHNTSQFRSSSDQLATVMKILVVLSAVLAVALAKPGFLGAGVVGPAYAAGLAAAVQPAPVLVGGIHPGLAAYGPANIVIGPGGYPLDTPAVAAARAAHLTAVAQTRARDAVVNGAALAAAASIIALFQ
ncbi:uncharacterized protein LOC126355698 [Schistocerca gregaria]|uniref:uncharacterized protein LOC126355698 n=1 Tax=Schistocerca gregaria TaxID=7010 RepID=UPI00211E9105|nr:uncharacterized protein LOC126355698 [Schistocerca gregaria]